MKRFKFDLEQLLRLKLWREEEAKKALALEVEALERLKAKMEELRGELTGLFGDSGPEEDSFVDVPVRVGILQYASHLGGLIASQTGDIAAQGERLKEKSDALLKAMQERKVLEKLKERRQTEHRQAVGRFAYAALDEASAGLLRRAGERSASEQRAEDALAEPQAEAGEADSTASFPAGGNPP